MAISRMDFRCFISEPFQKCPNCGMETYGVLRVHGGFYIRRCTECRHRSERIPLPPLKKTVVYLDQLAISNMMLATNPDTRAHQQGKVDPFWADVHRLLTTLCLFQVVVCPTSEFHIDESLLSEHYQKLKKVYEQLGGGVRFENQSTIFQRQIERQIQKWMGSPDVPPLTVEDVTYGSVNGWQPLLRFTSNLNLRSLIPGIRAVRDAWPDRVRPIFERSQTEQGRNFHEWYEEEREGAVSALLESGHLPADPFNGNQTTLAFIRDALKAYGVDNSNLEDAFMRFVRSPELKDTPFIRIQALLYAQMARRFAGGRKELPTRGFRLDVEMIAALLPFCDAMFVDNECRSLLTEDPIPKELGYGTRIFSANIRDEFLNYLAGMIRAIPDPHLEKVKEVYGYSLDKGSYSRFLTPG